MAYIIDIKIELKCFFGGKNFVLKFLGQKVPKMDPKWSAWSFMKNQCMKLLIFCSENKENTGHSK